MPRTAFFKCIGSHIEYEVDLIVLIFSKSKFKKRSFNQIKVESLFLTVSQMAEGGLKAGHLNSKFKLRECAEIVFPCPGEKN